jgi:hypothetical protein
LHVPKCRSQAGPCRQVCPDRRHCAPTAACPDVMGILQGGPCNNPKEGVASGRFKEVAPSVRREPSHQRRRRGRNHRKLHDGVGYTSKSGDEVGCSSSELQLACEARQRDPVQAFGDLPATLRIGLERAVASSCMCSVLCGPGHLQTRQRQPGGHPCHASSFARSVIS